MPRVMKIKNEKIRATRVLVQSSDVTAVRERNIPVIVRPITMQASSTTFRCLPNNDARHRPRRKPRKPCLVRFNTEINVEKVACASLAVGVAIIATMLFTHNLVLEIGMGVGGLTILHKLP
jgi:hypothetical protein